MKSVPSYKTPKLHIAMNREGALAAFFFLGLGGAALYSGNNGLLLLFCWLFSAIFLMCVLAVRNSSSQITIERRFCDEIFAGTDAHIDVLITNHSNKTLYGLHIYERFEDNRFIGPMFVRKLPPNSTVTAQYMCMFVNRGNAHFCGFQVRSRFPLPFFELRYDFPAEASAFIYPAPLPGLDHISFQIDDAQTPESNHSSRDTTIREIIHGRKTGKILWKLSARKQKWIEAVPVRSRTNDSAPVIEIMPRKLLGSDIYEKQISQITAYVLNQIQYEKKGEILVGNARHLYGNSPVQRREILEMLSTV